MPIRPENLHRYPRDWNETSARIQFERAGGRCECKGHCGLAHPGGRCPAVHEQLHPDTGSVAGFTTAHLNHTPEDVRDAGTAGYSNLRNSLPGVAPAGIETFTYQKAQSHPSGILAGATGRGRRGSGPEVCSFSLVP